MLKKLILSLALLLTLGFGATFKDGLNAVNKGDFKTAFTLFEDLASKGDADAQYNLGVMYYNGDGVQQDYQKAKEYFEKATNQLKKTSKP